MNIDERRNRIVELLDKYPYLTAEEAAEYLDISIATIRRDFIQLEKENRIIRFHGGIKKAEATVSDNNNFQNRSLENRDSKIKIARYAAKLIKDNDIIFVDASSTVYYLADYISAKNIQLFTNSIYQADRFIRCGFGPYFIGGITMPDGYTYSADTIAKLQSIHFDKTFLGASCISRDRGLTTITLIDQSIKSIVIAQSSEVYTLADSTKFNQNAPYTYAGINDTTIITDREFENIDLYPNCIVI